MRISRLTIHNYRSIRDLTLDCQPLVSLLGPNNHGKSNILAALDFGLSTSAKPTVNDFFAHRQEEAFWVEMTFSELTEQERNTFKRYVRADNSVRVRKTCKREADDKLEISYNGYVQEPEERWLKADSGTELTKREAIAQTPLTDLVPKEGRLTKAIVEEAQQKYIEAHRAELKFSESLETGPFLGQKNIGGGVLPDFYLIPAVKDLTEEIRIKTTTSFGRLLGRAIREMAERDPRFIQVREQLGAIIHGLNERAGGVQAGNELERLEHALEEDLKAWGVKVSIEVKAPDIEKIFELGTDLHLDDGIKTAAERKGHGLQRAVIFALLRSWARVLREKPAREGELAPRKQSESVIFAMEEPELFLHPHAQRRLARSLRDIAGTPEHQVFLCTHSSHFVDLNYYREVAIISKASAEQGSMVRQCNEELFTGNDIADRKRRFHMAQWVNPDRAEMFFAKRVAFVEGETERTVLPYLAERLDCYDPEVSVIECGAKHNLPLYVTIAKAFQIPYVVVHDEDPLPDPIPADWDEDKRNAKQRTFALNQEIAQMIQAPLGKAEMVSPDFEGLAGVSRSQGDRKGKALAALDHFAAAGPEGVPPRLTEIVRAVYTPQG